MTTIKLKNGSGAPLASDLVQGEPALDLTNKRLYTEDSGGAVIEVGVNPTELNVTNNITVGGTVDGRDIATDGTKLDGIEAGADVTDTANVTAAGALMDSELTSEASVKALNQGVATTDSPTFAGLTTTANVSFGDNDKATFGAGSDLQIYHNGSNSFIQDVGTGNLYITTNGSEIRLAPQGANENGIRVLQDGAVYAYHDNSLKLATTSTGIDVTGTAVASSLKTDSGDNDLTLYGFTGTNYYQSDGVHRFYGNSGNRLDIDGTTGDISFYNSAGTSKNFYWDASTSRLGLGTTSPSAPLSVKKASTGVADIVADFGNTAVANGLQVITSDGNLEWGFNALNSRSMVFQTNQTERMRLDSSGRLGLGTTSPSRKLHVNASGVTALFGNTEANNSIELTRTTSDASYIGLAANSSAAGIIAGPTFTFSTSNSGGGAITERMRIDSSGNVGIGTTSPNSTLEVSGTSAGGEVEGLRLTNSSTTANTSSSIIFNLSTASADSAKIAAIRTNSPTSSDTELAFSQLRNGTLTERMRIDSEGNVGIGTTSPSTLIEAQSTDARITLTHTGGNSLQLYQQTTSSYLLADDNFQIHTNGSERMRIDSSGNLMVGTTDSSAGINGSTTQGICLNSFYDSIFASRSGGAPIALNRQTSDGDIAVFRKDGTTAGSISVTASATAYNTSSDQRLKDNIVDAPSASDDIDAIQVRSFDWKADGSHQKYGMVAQELQSVAPEAVTGDADSDEMMAVDYSKLVPMLVKEIQSLRARVAQLEGAN